MPEKPEIKNPDSPPAPVPYIAYETSLASEREHSRRLSGIICALIAALVITNLAWLWAWLQYDYVSDTVTVESSAGHANFIGANGDIYNGKDSLQEAEANP